MPAPSTPGTVLLLGGTGKVGSRVTALLQAASVPALVASRSGGAPPGLAGVRFDWDDRTTWEPVFSGDTPIKAVLLVERGGAPDLPQKMRDFVDLARVKGPADRFVLLSASSIPEDGLLAGQTHRYLHDLGDRGEIGWAVLRPTWFDENLTEVHSFSINGENKTYSATGPGRIPRVSADDIAAVGFHALTAPQPPNRDFVILGPELLTYSDIAAIFTSALGRDIAYHELTEDEFAARARAFGLSESYAAVLARMETAIHGGSEEATNDVVRSVTGREPRRFRDFVEDNKAVWMP
ncbi:putative ergot alkaloid A [Hypoxylon sp. FL1284]|nr:putative ergot alkaloid A [Hypoxylon sp. FL1284]